MMQPEQLAALLSRYPEIRLALLFGSMATGKARADSDIDLGFVISWLN